MEFSQGLLDTLEKLLKCPVCLKIPSGSIFQCRIGHTVCESCRQQILVCPTCNSPMTDTKNFFAQQLAQQVKVICKYKEFGCLQKISKSESEAHHDNCEFRPLICDLHCLRRNDCGKMVKKKEYLIHILNDHYATSIPESASSITISQKILFEITHKTKLEWKDMPPIIHLKNLGRDFLLVTSTFNFTTPFWALYVFESELQTDTIENWATITIQHPFTKMELSFKAPVHPIRNIAHDISRSGMCLTVSRNTFKAVSYYDPIKQFVVWNLIVTFHNVGESKIKIESESLPLPTQSCKVNTLGNISCRTGLITPSSTRSPSLAGSTTSLRPDKPEPEWPFSADPHKVIDIAVQTNFELRHGAGVIVIRGKGQSTLFSRCITSKELKFSNSKNHLELEAHNAIIVLRAFDKFFTPGAQIYISCIMDISKVGQIGTRTVLLNQQLGSLADSKNNLKVVFKDYDKRSIEAIAVESLMVSTELCDNALRIAGIREVGSSKIESASMTPMSSSPLPLGNGNGKEGRVEAPPRTEDILPVSTSSPSIAISATSEVFRNRVEASQPEWPFSTGFNFKSVNVFYEHVSSTLCFLAQHKFIDIAVRTDFGYRNGGGVCIIRGNGKISLFSTCLTSSALKTSHATNPVELEAHNTVLVLKEFKKMFTPGTKVCISCLFDISKVGLNGSYTAILNEQLINLRNSRKYLEFIFKDYKRHRIEVVAVESLIISTEMCNSTLRKAGFKELKTGECKVESASVASSPLPSESESCKEYRAESQSRTEEMSPRTSSRSSSIAMSATSEVSRNRVEAPEPEWPFSADQHKVIDIAVRADLKYRKGGGVCIIRGKGKSTLFSTYLNSSALETSHADNQLELEAHNTVIVLKTFKKFFTPGAKVHISCLFNISKVGLSGSYTSVLNQQLRQLQNSKRNLEFIFKEYDHRRIEIVAVEALLVSTEMCDIALGKAGIKEVGESDIKSASVTSISSSPFPFESCTEHEEKSLLQTEEMSSPSSKSPSIAGSATSKIFGNRVAASEPEWPFSADPDKVINIAVRTEFECRNGGDVSSSPFPSESGREDEEKSLLQTEEMSSPSSKSPSIAGSATSEVYGNRVAGPEPEWPFSADPDKIIDIAVRTEFDWKNGGGVCIIRGNGRSTLFSTCLTSSSLLSSDAQNHLELEAQNTIIVLKAFKKLFTPGAKINISCILDISKVGLSGSYTSVLNQQLKSLENSRGNLKFIFKEYDPKRLEMVAVDSLLLSTEICNKLLRNAGIKEICEQDINC